MRHFYTTDDDERFARLKTLEQHYLHILEEVPEFNLEAVRIKRLHNEWYNTGEVDGWDKFLEALKVNRTWIAGWDKDNCWFNFPLMQRDVIIGAASELCPFTIGLLKDIGGINIAGFALLLPHSKLPPHTDTTGPSYGSIAFNMKLSGGASALHVGPHGNHEHVTGRAVLFNSEVPHYATNDGDVIRIILYLDVALLDTF